MLREPGPASGAVRSSGDRQRPCMRSADSRRAGLLGLEWVRAVECSVRPVHRGQRGPAPHVRPDRRWRCGLLGRGVRAAHASGPLARPVRHDRRGWPVRRSAGLRTHPEWAGGVLGLSRANRGTAHRRDRALHAGERRERPYVRADRGGAGSLLGPELRRASQRAVRPLRGNQRGRRALLCPRRERRRDLLGQRSHRGIRAAGVVFRDCGGLVGHVRAHPRGRPGVLDTVRGVRRRPTLGAVRRD